jgi:hypothetical protein
MQGLITLDLFGNQLRRLPSSLVQLTKLRLFGHYNNPIEKPLENDNAEAIELWLEDRS